MQNKDLNNIHNTQFEQLLKKSLLENSDNEFNNKIMDINANYIFNKSAELSVNTNKISSLINRQLTENKPTITIYYYLKYIIPIVLIVSVNLLFYKYNNNTDNGNLVPVITENLQEVVLNTDYINKMKTKQAVLLNQKKINELIILQDTISKENKAIIKQKTVITSNLELLPDCFPDDYEVPESVSVSVFEDYFYYKNGRFVIIGDYIDKYKDFPEKHINMFKPFDIDKYILESEVTNGMWRSFLLNLLNTGQKQTALKCIPKDELWSKYNQNYIHYFKEQKYNQLPVVNISSEVMQIFNMWLTNKFNNYALRKFACVEFTLPNDNDWDGKPSPMVGFRPVLHIKSYINYEKSKGLKSKTPPGTILLDKYFGVDKFEIRNVDYKEFLYYMKNVYCVSDKEYNQLLPNTNCWIDSNLSLIPSAMQSFKEKYFSHLAFSDCPVVGVSYEQALKYCEWRSKIVTQNYVVYSLKHPKAKNIPLKVTYRLPTPYEWELIAKETVYYVKSNTKLTKTSKKTKNIGRITHLGPTSVKSLSKNRIGVYGFDTNVSEMTSNKGVAKGGNWYQKNIKQNKKLIYTNRKAWLGFRCVVDIEY